MKGNKDKIGNSDSIGNSDRVGKSDSIGNSDRVGKSDSIGKSDRVGNLDLSLKRIRGRREFFDEVLKYIKENSQVELTKLDAYFQYTTGSSETMIKQALAVLENVGLIESEEIHTGDKMFEIILRIKNKKEENNEN